MRGPVITLSQVFQEVGSLGQNLLIEKIAEKGTVGLALFGHGRPQYLLSNITIGYVAWQPFFK
jgi:hypothetical protein